MKKNKFNILIIFIIALIVMLPMFINPYHSSDDTMFHVTNIIELTNNIKINFFNPSKIVGQIANNFGYGTSLFYPPIAHYTVAYLSFLISNTTLSIEIIYLLSVFLSGVTMYYLSKRLSKNNLVALISATIYMLFPYHLSDIYIRDASAEAMVFIFLPIILSGLYELFSGNKNKFYILFTLGYVGGILSHLTLMIYFTILVLLFLLFNFKKTIKNIKSFILASIFILGISSPFLITMIEHKFLGDYLVFKSGVMAQGIQHSGLILYSYFGFLSDFKNHDVKYYLDIVTIILTSSTLLFYKQLKSKNYNIILFFILLSAYVSTLFFPWDLLPNTLRMIQFPWRMETFVALFLSLFAPLCITLLKDKNQKIVTFISIIGLVIFAVVGTDYRNDNLLDTNDLWYEGGMGWQKEYLPTNTDDNMDYYNNRSQDIIGNGTFEILENSTILKFSAQTNDIIEVELPRLFYYGYTLVDENNNKYDLYEDDYGFIATKISSGIYTLKYTGTVLDNLCIFISIISIGILIWFVRRKNEKN